MNEQIAPGLPPTPPSPSSTNFSRRYSHGDGPVCPYCGAQRITSAAVPCWLCQEMLPPLEGGFTGKPIRAREDKPIYIIIGILTIMLIVGLAIEAPGLLIVLALAATPPFIRAAVVSRRAREAGQPLTTGEKVGTFLGAIGSVVLVGLAAGVAFFVTCFAVCLGVLTVSNARNGGDFILPVSIIAGLVPGIIVFVWLAKLVWGKRKK